MKDYKRGSHTVWDCKYHLVWTTKYRYQVLEGNVGHRCRELLREMAISKEIGIVQRDGFTINRSGPPLSVSGLLSNSESLVIMRSIIDLAHNPGINVTAEGVETLEVWKNFHHWAVIFRKATIRVRP
jgi:hypothetical protein